MIRAIGNEQGLSATSRPAAPRATGTSFPDTFRALTATDDATGSSTFAIGHSAPGPAPRATDESAGRAKLDAALAEFKKELSMTPAERVRRDVLKKMDLTEEAVEAMPPKERAETEEKIAMEVARRMELMQGGTGRKAPVTAVRAMPS